MAMRNPSPELAMAVLLHDVGKPQTQTFAERIRFDDHDQAGAEIARDVCRRLRFSNDQLEQIVSLVGSHMRFMAVQRMKLSTLKRLLALSRFDEHLELHRLDCISSHGKLDNYEFLRQKLKEFSQRADRARAARDGPRPHRDGVQARPRFQADSGRGARGTTGGPADQPRGRHRMGPETGRGMEAGPISASVARCLTNAGTDHYNVFGRRKGISTTFPTTYTRERCRALGRRTFRAWTVQACFRKRGGHQALSFRAERNG